MATKKSTKKKPSTATKKTRSKVKAKKKVTVKKTAAKKTKKKSKVTKTNKNPNRIHWIEIPVRNLDRAIDFYSKAFDVQLIQEKIEMGETLEMARFPNNDKMPGCSGALVKGAKYVPSTTGTLVYLTTKDMDTTITNILHNGGTLLVPKTTIGEYGSIAQFQDCEGNCLGLHAFASKKTK